MTSQDLSLDEGKRCNDVKVLGIDTATRICSVAITSGYSVMSEYLLSVPETHSEKLLYNIHKILDSTNLSLQSLNMIAVSLGPGSFTGLRVGISTARGLSFSAKKVLIGISTLEAMACHGAGFEGSICPMIGARKQQIYTCLFSYTKDGTIKKMTTEVAIELEKWLSSLKGRTLFLGEIAFEHREKIKQFLGELAVILPPFIGLPRASTFAQLALAKYLRDKGIALENISPVYVRPPDAEIKVGRHRGSFHPIIMDKTS